MSDAELFKQMKKPSSAKIFQIVWPKSWVRLWAWLASLLRLGRRRTLTEKAE